VSRRRFLLLTLLFALTASALGAMAGWLYSDFGTLLSTTTGPVASPEPLGLAPSVSAPPAVASAPEPAKVVRNPGLVGTKNILIAGIDRRPGERGGGLTDALILVVLDERSGRVGLVNIPRDLAIEIPNHGLDRINTVYGFAALRGDHPLTRLKEAVGELLAVTVHQVVVVNLALFEQLVDTLGGVTVDVPCPILDDFVDTRTESGRRRLDVPSGAVRMDGVTAAMYTRSRHGRSDFSRARRQQAVLAGIHRELLRLGHLGRLPEVWRAVERNVATDLKRYQLLALAERALTVEPDKLHGMVFSEREAEPRRDRGRALLIPNLAAIDRALARLFTAPPPGVARDGAVCPPRDIALTSRPRRAANTTQIDAGVHADEEPDDHGVVEPPSPAAP